MFNKGDGVSSEFRLRSFKVAVEHCGAFTLTCLHSHVSHGRDVSHVLLLPTKTDDDSIYTYVLSRTLVTLVQMKSISMLGDRSRNMLCAVPSVMVSFISKRVFEQLTGKVLSIGGWLMDVNGQCFVVHA